MEYYFELDVSLKQTSICVVNETGLAVREGVAASDPEAISVFVRSKAPDAVRIDGRTKVALQPTLFLSKNAAKSQHGRIDVAIADQKIFPSDRVRQNLA